MAAENKENVRVFAQELKRRIDDFSNGIAGGSPFDLGDWNGIPDFKGVTAPNVASLMFMVEEDGKRLLLTGDSQQDIILRGLRPTGFLKGGPCSSTCSRFSTTGRRTTWTTTSPGRCRRTTTCSAATASTRTRTWGCSTSS